MRKRTDGGPAIAKASLCEDERSRTSRNARIHSGRSDRPSATGRDVLWAVRLGLLGAVLVPAVLLPPSVSGRKKPPPALSRDHVHPSGAFSFRTPEGWTVEPVPSRSDALQASGAGLMVRFFYYPEDRGYDSLHVDCMLERLAGPMETDPRVKYEYDFIGGELEGRRALDSAFLVRYDAPVHGHKEWRQRNVTIVGGNQSLCLVSYAPRSVWKKSREMRALLDGVLASVTFRGRP